MHSTGVAIASLLAAAASVIGTNLPSIWILVGLATIVALIGVPHGGLDHLTGRKLLAERLPNTWFLVFFPAYLTVAMFVVAGWLVVPAVTAVVFFIISAWHFGLEDNRRCFGKATFDNLSAVAVGGLVIWIPMLTQEAQISSILQSVVPSNLAISVSAVVDTSQVIACGLIPIAAFVIAKDAWKGSWMRAFRNSSFAVLFASTDVLISFGIYFCGWHSIRGLASLATTHGMSPTQLAKATAPLSLGAICLAGLGMWYWSSRLGSAAALNRALFVFLSAMAVPHLLLHGPITELTRKFGLARTEVPKTAEVMS